VRLGIAVSTVPAKRPLSRQILRYGVVGVLNNLSGYLVYLLITFLGVDPKIVVSFLFPLSATIAYFGHYKYSFSYGQGHTVAMMRYALAQIAGYGLNIAMLHVLSDRLNFPHQAVQAAAIFVVAGLLFLLFKYFVFPIPKDAVRSAGEGPAK